MSLIARSRKIVGRCLTPLTLRAARSYVAGERLEDAVRVADTLSGRGLGVTLGFWDAPGDSPLLVADAYLEGIRALAGREYSYLSIKVPSLGYSPELLSGLVEQATRDRVRLHFDALSPDTADRSRALFDRFVDSGAELSYTLPGRWARSVDDAAWAVERGVTVRVVKGQWPDPIDPKRSMHDGYLQVIDALVGRARHVAVATHDVPLAIESIRRLRAAGTSCGMELLYGLPMPPSLEAADWLAVGVHVYVPYGRAYLPYALSRVRSNPRILWWLMRDAILARKRDTRPEPQKRELIANQ
jgi:proline dehydrogenase